MANMLSNISLADYLEICQVAFDWVTSYDTKDWKLLHNILAPSTLLDFSVFGMGKHENLTPDAYVAIIADKKVLGGKRLKTQHLISIPRWEYLGEGHITVKYQARVAHQRHTSEESSEVANKGHAHGYVQHWYRKIDGAWKLEGVKPSVVFVEYDLMAALTPGEDEEIVPVM